MSTRVSRATRESVETALNLLGKLPTTNARIAMTLLLGLGTAIRYWAAGRGDWEPSWEWLGFLVVWAGIDAAQFHSKRKTYDPGKAADQATPSPSQENGG